MLFTNIKLKNLKDAIIIIGNYYNIWFEWDYDIDNFIQNQNNSHFYVSNNGFLSFCFMSKIDFYNENKNILRIDFFEWLKETGEIFRLEGNKLNLL